MTTKRKSIAIGLAAAITLGSGVTAGTAIAAPLAANQLALKDAAASDVVNVHRRGHRNGAAFAALAIGVIGAVIAHQEYKRHRKRHHHHYHPYAYHAHPYAYRGYHHYNYTAPPPKPGSCHLCGVM
jgi:hypothetical protein